MIPIEKQRTKCADKNDRLGWTCGFVIRIGEGTVGVRTNDPAMLETLRGLLPQAGEPCPDQEVDVLLSFLVGGYNKASRKGQKHYHLVYESFQRRARTLELQDALDTFRDVAHSLLSFDRIYFRSVTAQIGTTICHLVGKDLRTDAVLSALKESQATVQNVPYAIFNPEGDLVAHIGGDDDMASQARVVLLQEDPALSDGQKCLVLLENVISGLPVPQVLRTLSVVAPRIEVTTPDHLSDALTRNSSEQ
jgi:hypothetical protein